MTWPCFSCLTRCHYPLNKTTVCLNIDFFSSWFTDRLGTYGLTLLGSWKPCASAWGLRGGGWGRRAGSVGWGAFCTGDWITPFRPPSTPFIFSWGLPARDAISPPTTGSEELPAWLMVPKPSLKPRLRPFSMGWLKEAGLCWGGGVLWKEREELLRDGLPEWSSWNKDVKYQFSYWFVIVADKISYHYHHNHHHCTDVWTHRFMLQRGIKGRNVLANTSWQRFVGCT